MALDYSIIGHRIKKIRIEKNITQELLAEKLDVSVAYISRIERGKAEINLKRLSEICEILQVNEGYILNGVSNSSSEYLISDFNEILKKCSPDKQKLIYEVAKTIIEN